MTASQTRYEALLQPPSLSSLPPQVPVIRIVPDRPPPDLGTFVFPASPLPLPVMPVDPTWSSPNGSGGGNGALSSPTDTLVAAEAANEAAAVILDAKPLPKTEKERRRMERERERVERLEREREREREREKERERERQQPPAMVVPAPSYVFTMLIPSAALFITVPDVLALWGTQANAPAFSSSGAGGVSSSAVMMARAASSSSRASKKEKEASTTAASLGEASGGDMWEGTIGYTDDSDVRLMVLHAGFVTLDDMRAAKLGQPTPHTGIGLSASGYSISTLEQVVQISSTASTKSSSKRTTAKERAARTLAAREARHKEHNQRAPPLMSSGGKRDLAVHLLWRGVKSRFKSSLGPVSGGSIQSAAWGTSHDGGALEIERVEWLPVSFIFFLFFPSLTDGCAVLASLDMRIRDISPIVKCAWRSMPMNALGYDSYLRLKRVRPMLLGLTTVHI